MGCSHTGAVMRTATALALGLGAPVLGTLSQSSRWAWARGFYLRPERHDAGQEANEDVRVHAPLVGFVDEHHLVSQQQEVLGRGSV